MLLEDLRIPETQYSTRKNKCAPSI